jgi:hypothetical protein
MAPTPTPLDLIEQLLRDAFGINAPVADDGGIHLQFEVDLNVAIALSPDQADLVLYSVLGPAVGRRGIALVTAALALNLHQVATRGGAIGLDTDHHTLVFSWRMRLAGSEPPQWLSAIEQFCITTRELNVQLKEAIDPISESEWKALEDRARDAPELLEADALDGPAALDDPEEGLADGADIRSDPRSYGLLIRG